MKKSFTTLDEETDELENKESDHNSSDSEDSDVNSHFEFHNNSMEPHKGFQMFHIERNNCNQTPGVGVVLQQAPGNSVKKVLPEKKHSDSIDLNLRKVILLENQSTMDLLSNEDMVERI